MVFVENMFRAVCVRINTCCFHWDGRSNFVKTEGCVRIYDITFFFFIRTKNFFLKTVVRHNIRRSRVFRLRPLRTHKPTGTSLWEKRVRTPVVTGWPDSRLLPVMGKPPRDTRQHGICQTPYFTRAARNNSVSARPDNNYNNNIDNHNNNNNSKLQ